MVSSKRPRKGRTGLGNGSDRSGFRFWFGSWATLKLYFRNVLRRNVPDACLVLPFPFFEGAKHSVKENTPKQGILIPTTPPKSSEKKGNTLNKARILTGTKKQRKSKRNKERKIFRKFVQKLVLLFRHLLLSPGNEAHQLSGKQTAKINLRKILGTPARCPGTPGATNRGLPAGAPGISCCLQKTDRKGHICQKTSQVSQEHPAVQGASKTLCDLFLFASLQGFPKGGFCVGNGGNTVSESTVSNTELSEFFGTH